MRFNVLHNESNTIFGVVKIHQWWKLWLLHIIVKLKSIHYFKCGSEIPLSLSGQNLVHMPQSAVTSWKLTVEILEQCVKYVQS